MAEKKPTSRTRAKAPATAEGKLAEGVRAASVPGDGDRQTSIPPEIRVTLQRSETSQTVAQPLWVAVRNRSRAIGFNQYLEFIDRVLCEDPEGELPYRPDEEDRARDQRKLVGRLHRTPRAFRGVDAYQLLKTATEIFLLIECGVKVDDDVYSDDPDQVDAIFRTEEEPRLRSWPVADVTIQEVKSRLADQYLGQGRLPYINRIVDSVFQGEEDVDSPFCFGILRSAVDCPCLLELIWSYWHEEGMLVQGLNAIGMRFQNKSGPGAGSPLAQLAVTPLRPLNNLFWGYLQDERDRLTVARRAYEYDHHYGLTLMGKAVPKLRSADSRSRFLEAFHTLLQRTWTFYQEDADTTVVANGFPMLNGLREVHMLLAEGAHNQFGDLPWTARVEMLIQQWFLSRPEIQDFLRGRAMVPYKEAWMGQADTLNKLLGWTDVSVSHFRDLAVYGEQVLLSVRYDDWIDDGRTEDDAKNWAHYFKQEIQGYMHAYRAATGADLTTDRVDTTMPAVHLARRGRVRGAATRAR